MGFPGHKYLLTRVKPLMVPAGDGQASHPPDIGGKVKLVLHFISNITGFLNPDREMIFETIGLGIPRQIKPLGANDKRAAPRFQRMPRTRDLDGTHPVRTKGTGGSIDGRHFPIEAIGMPYKAGHKGGTWRFVKLLGGFQPASLVRRSSPPHGQT